MLCDLVIDDPTTPLFPTISTGIYELEDEVIEYEKTYIPAIGAVNIPVYRL
jgi:hypothetical protein